MPLYGLIHDSVALHWATKGLRAASRSAQIGAGSRSVISTRIYLQKLIIYKPILNYELNHRHGMVGQHLHRVAEGILRDAQKQVHVKTGKLQRSLHIEHIQGASGQSVRVGSDLKYAYLHHEGTKPHIITPNPPNKTLRFGSGSRVVYTNMVRHPGTKANRYLTDQLRTHVR